MKNKNKISKNTLIILISCLFIIPILVSSIIYLVKYKKKSNYLGLFIPLEMASKISRILYENNIKHWLDTGTLLGSWREQQIIAHDNDVDFAYLKSDQDKILQVLKAKLPKVFKIEPHGAYNENIIINGPFKGPKHMMRSGFDLYGYKDKGAFLQIEAYSKPIPKKWVFPLTWGKLEDKYFPIPKDAKSILELYYGNLLKNAKYNYEAHTYVSGNKNISIKSSDNHKKDKNYITGIPTKFVSLLQEIAPEWWEKCVSKNRRGFYLNRDLC